MSLLVSLLVLSIIIFVHELGHFTAARAVGIPITQFAVGMGKEVIGFTRGNTRYRLNIFPIGGYVTMGEIDGKPAIDAQPYWAKALFLSAGVIVNLVFSVLLLAVMYGVGGTVTVTDGESVYSGVIESRSAFEALQAASDTVLSMAGQMLSALPSAIASLFVSPATSELTGPIGVVNATQATSEYGFIPTIYMAAVLSVAVAVFNILPIPPLDGGHLLIHTVEAVIRRPLPDKALGIFMNAGLFLLLGLTAAVVVLDIFRLL